MKRFVGHDAPATFDGWEYVRTYEPGEKFPALPVEHLDFTHCVPRPEFCGKPWEQPERIDRCHIGNGCRCDVYRRMPNASGEGREV